MPRRQPSPRRHVHCGYRPCRELLGGAGAGFGWIPPVAALPCYCNYCNYKMASGSFTWKKAASFTFFRVCFLGTMASGGAAHLASIYGTEKDKCVPRTARPPHAHGCASSESLPSPAPPRGFFNQGDFPVVSLCQFPGPGTRIVAAAGSIGRRGDSWRHSLYRSTCPAHIRAVGRSNLPARAEM